ncbi:7TM-DISM domain-containing protein [Flectobacillus sp. DC10W]|uniref:histidine kinase n=1 Tax=Flectobacillus longus TaxID=2984207 RepID=A0ABT6YIA4_9BACT|nr:ATP-binding protein [Flectobacillus longus]MDI9863328.1 7TM-DISM domain-containing protein [Flectobacillus longus]
MNPIRLIYFLPQVSILLFVAICSALGFGGDSTSVIQLGSTFRYQVINQKTYVAQTYSSIDTNHIFDAKQFQFIKNQQKEVIELGKAYVNKNALMYFEVVNHSTENLDIVLEASHTRLDQLECYLIKNNKPILLEKLQRNTPLYLRKNPYLYFSFPLEIAPTDTVKVLLHSVRHYGLHMTNLELYRKPAFFQHAIIQNLKSIFQLIYCFIFTVVLLLLGFYFSEKLMIYAGVMIGAANANMCTVSYFYDLFPFPSFLNINACNIGSFWILGLNVLFHPFAYEVVQTIPINLKRYTIGAKVLVVLNMAVMALHFLPSSYFTLFVITNSLFPLTLINTLWAIFHAALLFVKGKRIDYLVACLLGVLPTMLKSITNYFLENQENLILNSDYFTPFVVVILISYISFEQFRKNLIFRKIHESKMDLLKDDMESIRKNEVENIGRQLHDQVGNTLAAALGYLNKKNTDVFTSKKILEEAINDIRFMSHNLVKDDSQSLITKLARVIEQYDVFSNITFHFHDFTEGKVNQIEHLTQQNIYMILKECLMNIVKHSKAQEAFLQIFEQENGFRFMIEDDGVGFDVNQEGKGIGLLNMRKRAFISNLKVNIESNPAGTTIIIETM